MTNFPPILYEDENMLVINKPAGLVVHGDGRGNFETLADQIIKNFPELKYVGEPLLIDGETIYRPGIVHRLDKDTSGALIIAKNQESFENLKEQFQNHEIQKVYRAFLYGALKDDKGVINEPIGRSNGDIRRWATGRSARGTMREAITEYKVLARYGLPEGVVKGSTEIGTYTYIEAMPKTGRTHQIRVHFRHLNHPVVCDILYATGREAALGFKRLALHAYKITFKKLSGEDITVEAPLPEDFVRAEGLAPTPISM